MALTGSIDWPAHWLNNCPALQLVPSFTDGYLSAITPPIRQPAAASAPAPRPFNCVG